VHDVSPLLCAQDHPCPNMQIRDRNETAIRQLKAEDADLQMRLNQVRRAIANLQGFQAEPGSQRPRCRADLLRGYLPKPLPNLSHSPTSGCIRLRAVALPKQTLSSSFIRGYDTTSSFLTISTESKHVSKSSNDDTGLFLSHALSLQGVSQGCSDLPNPLPKYRAKHGLEA
jgi:hypothetical protein